MNEKTIVSKSIHVISLKKHFWEKSVQTVVGIEDRLSTDKLKDIWNYNDMEINGKKRYGRRYH